jgi:hypothetical protein
MYKVVRKRREMGLGSLADVSLSEARQKAADARRTLAEGQDPLGAKRAAQDARKAQEAHPTFGAFADQMLASKEHGWSNDTHRPAPLPNSLPRRTATAGVIGFFSSRMS